MFKARVVRKRHHRLVPPRGPSKVKVGLLDGESASKGVWNEFGTSRGIPERPFMRNTMREQRGPYMQHMRGAARKILLGQTSVTAVVSRLGARAQGDVQAMITSLSSPPNAPATIAEKGSSNPLIDTGAMRAAVSWEITE